MARGEGKFPYFTLKFGSISKTELETSGWIEDNLVHLPQKLFCIQFTFPISHQLRYFIFRDFAKLFWLIKMQIATFWWENNFSFVSFGDLSTYTIGKIKYVLCFQIWILMEACSFTSVCQLKSALSRYFALCVMGRPRVGK